MSDIDLKDLADYHTEIWHERNGWVATERSVTPSVQLFKIGYVLGMEKLKEENARLREALEFYADKRNWETPEEQGYTAKYAPHLSEGVADMLNGDSENIGSIEIGGKRARKALERSDE